MHVYDADKPGEKTYNAGRPVIKSTYKNEQTCMLYIRDLDGHKYINTKNLLNLCLDQTQRTRDLYFKVSLFSSVPFNAQKLGKKYGYK